MLRFPFLVGPKGVVKKSLSIVVEKDGRFFSWFSGFAIPRSSKVTSSWSLFCRSLVMLICSLFEV